MPPAITWAAAPAACCRRWPGMPLAGPAASPSCWPCCCCWRSSSRCPGATSPEPRLLVAPALDDLGDELAPLVIGLPGFGEVRRLALRAVAILEVLEADAHRVRHAFADHDRFALA